VTSHRFIAIEGLQAVTVGDVRDAEARLGARFGVVIEHGEPSAVLWFEELPSDADVREPLVFHPEPLEPLQVVEGVVAGAEAAGAVGFASDFVVLVHDDNPFLVPSSVQVSDTHDVTQLLGSSDSTAIAALGRLPGPLEPIPPTERRCLCPRGHRVTLSPGQAAVCPAHGLALMC
jgi:hypothetical protein